MFGYTFAELLIAVIIIAAAVAILYVALRKLGITIPDWVVQIFWIVVVAVVSIAAIRFVMRL